MLKYSEYSKCALVVLIFECCIMVIFKTDLFFQSFQMHFADQINKFEGCSDIKS